MTTVDPRGTLSLFHILESGIKNQLAEMERLRAEVRDALAGLEKFRQATIATVEGWRDELSRVLGNTGRVLDGMTALREEVQGAINLRSKADAASTRATSQIARPPTLRKRPPPRR